MYKDMVYVARSRRANLSQVQCGDACQGLRATATGWFISSGRAGWNNYLTRTGGRNRDLVFCMNTLSGVGAGKSQFHIPNLNKPDGARRCKPYKYVSKRDLASMLEQEFIAQMEAAITAHEKGQQQSAMSDIDAAAKDVLEEAGVPLTPDEEQMGINLISTDLAVAAEEVQSKEEDGTKVPESELIQTEVNDNSEFLQF